jgi:excisionase family DNA binding protein
MAPRTKTEPRGTRLLTPSEVAERLQFSPRTVVEWLRWEELKGLKIGHQWRIREEDLAKFLEERRP